MVLVEEDATGEELEYKATDSPYVNSGRPQISKCNFGCADDIWLTEMLSPRLVDGRGSL